MGAEVVNPLHPAPRPSWLALTLAAAAFGSVEAILATAYRRLLDPNGQLFPLVVLPPALIGWEHVREAATLVLLAAIACLAVRRAGSRVAAFFYLFGLWDVTYYAVLRCSLGWPESLGDWDLLFLVPVPWLGPVYAPLLVAVLFVLGGAYVLRHESRHGAFRIHVVHALGAAAGALLVVWSFTEDEAARSLTAVPARYAVEYLGLGIGLAAVAFADAVRRNRPPRRPVR